MGFVDFPEKKEPKKPKLKMQHTQNGTFLNRGRILKMDKPHKVMRVLKHKAKHYTTPLLADTTGRNLAGTKLTKTQVKNVQKRRSQAAKKNKKIAKSIWRKLF